MTDAVAVFDSGWQMPVNPSTQLPYTDGIIKFFDAGTTNPKTVYSDAALSTSLGQEVSCNSLGYPVTSGNAKTLIYVGSASYKIQITSVIFGGVLFEADNVKGALDTSSFLTSAAVADRTPTPVSANHAVTSADKGKVLEVNSTSGNIDLTFDSAADLGSGFWITLRHVGTANKVHVTGTDPFSLPGVASTTSFSLVGYGQSITIAGDGATLKAISDIPPLINATTGLIAIADRTSTPPGSPVGGARYIVTSSPTGAWSSFAEHDIAEATGQGTWFKYTPVSNCGWAAYVQDEQVNYQFRGSAWVAFTASDTVAGFIEIADQSEMEAATDTTRAVTPAMQIRHPAHTKVGIIFNGFSAPPTPFGTSYGAASITDNATGIWTINFSTAYSSTNYWFVGSSHDTTSLAPQVITQYNDNTKTVSAIKIANTQIGSGRVYADGINQSFFSGGDFA